MKKFARTTSMIVMLLVMHSATEILADELPPIGERVYMGDADGKYGSLEIKKRLRAGGKKDSSGVIFRDPELDTVKVGENNRTAPGTEDKSKYEGDNTGKASKRQYSVEQVVPRKRKAPNELEEENQQVNSINRSNKSILDLGATKISGRHKQPTIPFNKIPIHLEQTFEPLNERFLNRIDENKLPGL